MKLYEIPRDSRIKLETENDNGEKLGDFIVFKKLDGAYSYCRVEGGSPDDILHLSASIELELTDQGHYEII